MLRLESMIISHLGIIGAVNIWILDILHRINVVAQFVITYNTQIKWIIGRDSLETEFLE